MLGSGTALNDRYTLISRVGGGGMGEVWRASDMVLGRTVAGAADKDDNAERCAVLRGRVRVDEGKRLTVVGVLRVIDHGPYAVGGVPVPAWAEVRIEQ